MAEKFLEWGTITNDDTAYTPTDLDDTPGLGQDLCHIIHPPTLPQTCEMEPDEMLSKDLPNPSTKTPEEPPTKRFRTDTMGQPGKESCPEITIVQEDMKVLYMVKGATPKTEEDWMAHNETVTKVLNRYGSFKILCDHWRIRGQITPQQRMERVLQFWSAGDIVPRNPFLNRNFWPKGIDQQPSEEDDVNLEGYEPTGENDRILSDINDLET